MAKNKDKMPEICFIGPGQKKGKFKYTVFLVESRENGVPCKLRMIREDEKVEVEEGMEFMTGYVPEHMARPKESASGQAQ